VRIALEAGKHSPWMSRLLEDLDFEVVVANPRKTRLIYENRRKSDRVDAQHLARLARADPELLHPIRHRSREAQVDLAAVRARDALVRSRTQLINHVRGAVKSLGSRIPKVSAQSFARRAMAEIPGELQPALSPLVRTIQDLTDRIRALERAADLPVGRSASAWCVSPVRRSRDGLAAWRPGRARASRRSLEVEPASKPLSA
jgi:transposase